MVRPSAQCGMLRNRSDQLCHPVNGDDVLPLVTMEPEASKPLTSFRQSEPLTERLKHRKRTVDGLIGFHAAGRMQINHDRRTINGE